MTDDWPLGGLIVIAKLMLIVPDTGSCALASLTQICETVPDGTVVVVVGANVVVVVGWTVVVVVGLTVVVVVCCTVVVVVGASVVGVVVVGATVVVVVVAAVVVGALPETETDSTSASIGHTEVPVLAPNPLYMCTVSEALAAWKSTVEPASPAVSVTATDGSVNVPEAMR